MVMVGYSFWKPKRKAVAKDKESREFIKNQVSGVVAALPKQSGVPCVPGFNFLLWLLASRKYSLKRNYATLPRREMARFQRRKP